MYISFNSRKLERNFNAAASLQKNYGDRMAKAIMKRMAVLRAARNLALVPTMPPEGAIAFREGGQGNTPWTLCIPSDWSSNPIMIRCRSPRIKV